MVRIKKWVSEWYNIWRWIQDNGSHLNICASGRAAPGLQVYDWKLDPATQTIQTPLKIVLFWGPRAISHILGQKAKNIKLFIILVRQQQPDIDLLAPSCAGWAQMWKFLKCYGSHFTGRKDSLEQTFLGLLALSSGAPEVSQFQNPAQSDQHLGLVVPNWSQQWFNALTKFGSQ